MAFLRQSWHKYPMTNLKNFTKEEHALLVSVPYRVGIWISNSDDNEKTKFDDKRERQALSLAVSKLAGRSKKMPFAAKIMQDIQSYKGMWANWEDHHLEKDILSDLQKAIMLCREKASKNDLNQYKYAVWQVGIVVAQSFGEHIDPDREMHVNHFFTWIGSMVSGPSLGKNPENMSPAEKIALKKLRAVLKQ